MSCPAKPVEHRLLMMLSKVDSGCWYFTGHRSPSGYGEIGVKKNGKNVKTQAHRVAYELWIGPIPAGNEVHHKCRNKACCFIEHLEACTPKEHMLEHRDVIEMMATKRRAQTHCKHGHPYNTSNTGWNRDGTRRCLTCGREQYQARRMGQGFPK